LSRRDAGPGGLQHRRHARVISGCSQSFCGPLRHRKAFLQHRASRLRFVKKVLLSCCFSQCSANSGGQAGKSEADFVTFFTKSGPKKGQLRHRPAPDSGPLARWPHHAPGRRRRQAPMSLSGVRRLLWVGCFTKRQTCPNFSKYSSPWWRQRENVVFSFPPSARPEGGALRHKCTVARGVYRQKTVCRAEPLEPERCNYRETL